MATINYDDGAVKTIGTAGLTTTIPGHGRSGPPIMSGQATRSQKVVTGSFIGDSSYPTGGEDISDIFDLFNVAGVSQLKGILVEQPTNSADTGKLCAVDYAAKKLKLFTALGTELGSGVTWASTTLRFIAWGPR